ncbi:MAG: hypothetical protein JW849_08020 [Phycisphaerae bacterium]|nr:hypothetical protein [Phycisphaerae bacterium]
MVSGFTDNSDVYPAPLIAPADLLALLEACMSAHNACTAAQAAAEQATADKN